jgi:hypothetical protein
VHVYFTMIVFLSPALVLGKVKFIVRDFYLNFLDRLVVFVLLRNTCPTPLVTSALHPSLTGRMPKTRVRRTEWICCGSMTCKYITSYSAEGEDDSEIC